ncbi:MAG: hypothetical protein NTX15_06800, partial [Candidatus Kapabacteria bacterium]|nr:hypothetical protein [Candidatus Kapabacteria bacterium]
TYRPAATAQPSLPAQNTEGMDMNDVNVPAYIRRQREQEQRAQAGVPRQEPLSSGSVPIVQPDAEQAAGGYQPPIRKAGGASSNQPAFLRKIMD